MGMYTVQIYCPDCDAWRPIRMAQKTVRNPVRNCQRHMRRRSITYGKKHTDANGYVRVRVTSGPGGIVYEHRWVWEQTHGPIPEGFHVHHRNHDRADNRLDNLVLVDGRNHVGHHATLNHGSGVIDNRGHLSGKWRHEIDDDHIVRRRTEGASFRQIGRELGIHHATIAHHYRTAITS